MLKKLARKLLMQVAEKLGRYAQSLEEYLAEENLPERDRVSVISNDEPPAHWLAKVRQAAPHLLDPTTPQNDFTTFHFGTGDQNSQLLSSHDRKQMERSGEQETLSNPAFSSKQSPETSNQSGHKLSDKVKLKYLFEPFKKLMVRLSPTAAHSSGRSEKESEDSLQIIHTGQNDPSDSTENTIPKKTTLLFREIDSDEIGQKRTSPQFQKIDTASSNKSKPILQSTSDEYRHPDTNKSELNKKASQQPEYSSKKTPGKNQHTIHLYPAPGLKIEANHRKRNNRAKNSRNELNTQDSSNDKRINRISATDQQSFIESKTNEPSNLLLPNTPQTNICKQHIAENNQTSETTEPVFFNSAPEVIEQKQKIFEPYKPNQFKPEFSQWPNLPDELKSNTNQDPWPQLPQEDWFKTKENDHHSYKYWQLQEEMKRKSLSEQEQRGKLWNG